VRHFSSSGQNVLSKTEVIFQALLFSEYGLQKAKSNLRLMPFVDLMYIAKHNFVFTTLEVLGHGYLIAFQSLHIFLIEGKINKCIFRLLFLLIQK
jgi:hypothetical protein